jgi:hypothetical protein
MCIWALLNTFFVDFHSSLFTHTPKKVCVNIFIISFCSYQAKRAASFGIVRGEHGAAAEHSRFSLYRRAFCLAVSHTAMPNECACFGVSADAL